MKKKALSLALALVMCLGLTVPAFAAEAKAGDTTVTDKNGVSYQLSNPILGTEKAEHTITDSDTDVVYLVPSGTVVTPITPQGFTFEWLDEETYTYRKGDSTLWFDMAMGWWDLGGYGGFNPEEGLVINSVNEVLMRSHVHGDQTPGGQPIPADKYNSESCTYFKGVKDSGTKPVDPEPDPQPADPKPTTPTIEVENIPASGTALASTQTVTVDGKKVEFQMYALADANGNLTNYIKLRDMAYILNGTKAQFAVGYDGTISLTTGKAYEAGGTEMTTPYSGDRAYTGGPQTLKVDGKDVTMTAITLTDDNGGGYNYFKLRDLGKALGFNVGYSNENGVFIESDKPYAE